MIIAHAASNIISAHHFLIAPYIQTCAVLFFPSPNTSLIMFLPISTFCKTFSYSHIFKGNQNSSEFKIYQLFALFKYNVIIA